MTISCIIPAWNLWETTRACLLSLAEHSQGEDMEVVVVDNGSTDATREALDPLGEQLFGARFTALHLPENQGFARGCNAGARAAHGEALFFVNNDITFTPGWLPPLREALSLPHVQAVGPLLLYPDGTCQHCGVSFSPLYTLCHLYEGFPGDHPALRRVHPLQALTGAALLLPRTAFQEAGGFHEGYRNGYEDLDLCLSLHSRGAKLRLAGQSLLYHHTSRTPGRFDRDRENAALFSSRWGEKIQPDLHIQAAVDGYEVRLGPTGRTYVTLPPARMQALEADAATMTAEDCCGRLREEPLWLGGYLRLAAPARAAGRDGAGAGSPATGGPLLSAAGHLAAPASAGPALRPDRTGGKRGAGGRRRPGPKTAAHPTLLAGGAPPPSGSSDRHLRTLAEGKPCLRPVDILCCLFGGRGTPRSAVDACKAPSSPNRHGLRPPFGRALLSMPVRLLRRLTGTACGRLSVALCCRCL